MRRWLFWPAPAAGGEQTVTVSITAGADDAVQTNSNGSMSLTSPTVTASANFTPAFRFLNITILNAATIVEATIQFTSATNQGGAINMDIFGQAADDAATFTTTTSDISSRAKTTAFVDWQIPAFTADERAAAEKTPDLKTIVQEIVNRAGWVSGNAMVFILANGTGVGQRALVALEHTTLTEATLTVRYTT